MTKIRLLTAAFGLVALGLAVACGSDGSSSGGGVKTVTLEGNCFMFEAGKEGGPLDDNCDLILEPWCAGKAGLCGN